MSQLPILEPQCVQTQSHQLHDLPYFSSTFLSLSYARFCQFFNTRISSLGEFYESGFNTVLSELELIATGILKGKMFNTPYIVSIIYTQRQQQQLIYPWLRPSPGSRAL